MILWGWLWCQTCLTYLPSGRVAAQNKEMLTLRMTLQVYRGIKERVMIKTRSFLVVLWRSVESFKNILLWSTNNGRKLNHVEPVSNQSVALTSKNFALLINYITGRTCCCISCNILQVRCSVILAWHRKTNSHIRVSLVHLDSLFISKGQHQWTQSKLPLEKI